MKKILLLLLILTAGLTDSFAVIRNVPGSFATIQSAINACANGDTVLAEPGTYFENINFRGKKIVVTSRFYLNNDISYISSTIINGSTPLVPDSASVVIIGSGADSTTVLQGFKITGGTGTKWTDEHGAGVYREGGGVLIALSNPVVRFNIIMNNIAMNITGVSGTGGGGIRAGDGSPKILNNIIMTNQGRYGAGIVLNYTGATVKNNIIYGNTQAQSFEAGAGIWADDKLGTQVNLIENNTIVGNTALSGTAGIASIYSATLVIRNNIIWGNTSPGNVQIELYSSGIATATYNDVQGGFTGTGNINLYPQFADSNFILLNSSPCIDAGDTAAAYNDVENSSTPGFAKFPSKGTLRNDMGAYGGMLSSLIAYTRVININKQGSEIPEGYKLEQNYPNPFNPVTIINWEMPLAGNVKISVYDIEGKEAALLVNEYKQAGSYSLDFNASSLSSGVYFYKLTFVDPTRRTGSFIDVKKMILLK